MRITMNQLRRKIIEKIGNEGPITFEKFMEMALYDPDFGYYASGRAGIGREGDFYTSAYLHPVFGAMIGRQLEEMWQFMGRPDDFQVVEMGAGAGYLCKDILDGLKDREFYGPLKYDIIELNPSMKSRQAEMLGEHRGKVRWVRSLAQVSGMRGCLLSNELLDAFPVHIVSMEEGLGELYVAAAETGLKEIRGPLSNESIVKYFSDFSIELEKGCVTEVNLRIRDWLRKVGASLDEGFVLTIDYGYTTREYYSEERNRGTLMCYSGHRTSEDPLRNIGEQDITAHVNFSSLSKWGEEEGLRTIGFCGQGAYLVSLGIDEEISRLAGHSKDYLFELARIKKLIMPQGMGESHMVMVQYKGGGIPELRGFKLRNRMRYL